MLSYFEYLMTGRPNDALALLICLPCVKGGAEGRGGGIVTTPHRYAELSRLRAGDNEIRQVG